MVLLRRVKNGGRLCSNSPSPVSNPRGVPIVHFDTP
jgi:hypothetical protein